MVTRHEHATEVGVFDSRAQAERAVDELHRAGFGDDRMGIATQGGDATGRGTTSDADDTHTGEVGATDRPAGRSPHRARGGCRYRAGAIGGSPGLLWKGGWDDGRSRPGAPGQH